MGELCDDAQKAEIEKYQAMSDADLEATKEAAIAAVKDSGLATLKVVKGYAGSILKCQIADESTCSEKEVKFITLMKGKTKEDWDKQVARLTKMAGGDMKAELKQWLWRRLRILKQLLA